MKLLRSTIALIFAATIIAAGCGNAAPGDNAGKEQSSQPASIAAVATSTTLASEPAISASQPDVAATATATLPRIIDFGSKQCQACKAMEPVLESMRVNHSVSFVTEFVDVWVPENQAFAKSHNIQSIPTQVFFDAEGKELYRNTGFISEEQVLAKWAELGIKTASSADSAVASASLSAE